MIGRKEDMSCFDYDDYREYLKDYIEALPKKGRGFAGNLAKEIGVSPVIVSQVLNGLRSFSLEQAYATAEVLGLNELDKEYFLTLVNLDRAGTQALSKHFESRKRELLSKHQEIKNRVKTKKELSDLAKATYYSNWYFVAIRLLVYREDINSIEDILRQVPLPRVKVEQALEFLEEYQLIDNKDGKYSWLGTATHISKDSYLVNRHHQNWRMKSQERLEFAQNEDTDLFFTSPMMIDTETAKDLKKAILDFISAKQDQINDAPAETIFSLNTDMFKVL